MLPDSQLVDLLLHCPLLVGGENMKTILYFLEKSSLKVDFTSLH